MPQQPGSPAAKMPPGEDALIRRIQELERAQREDRAAAAATVAPWAARTDDGAVAAGTQAIFGDPGASRVELDSAGLRKYATDGTTVQVDLTGEVAAFSGLITGSEIVGGSLRTGDTGQRVEIGTPDGPGEVLFYSGMAGEVSPARMRAITGGTFGRVRFIGGEITGKRTPEIRLDTNDDSHIYFLSDHVWINEGTGSGATLRIGGDTIDTNIPTLERAASTSWTDWYLTRRINVVANSTERAAFIADYTDNGRTITAASPLFFWKADEAAGSQLQSTVDGTTFATIGGGGSGGPLFADPGSDKIAFWDDSAGAFAALTPSTGLTLTGTDLTVRSASDTQTGIVELATSAETITGTDTTRAVTPAGVKAAITAIGASTGVSYSAGWADYGGAFSPATWYKDKDGWIRLSGLLKRTGATITGAASGTIFTLPVGARPAGNETFVMNKESSAAFCQVGSDGIVQVAAFLTWSPGSYMYLGGCQFKAA